MLCLVKCPTSCVEDNGGAVSPFLDVGGVGSADQSFAHFVGDGSDCVAYYLNGDRVDGGYRGGIRHHAAPSSIIRLW